MQSSAPIVYLLSIRFDSSGMVLFVNLSNYFWSGTRNCFAD